MIFPLGGTGGGGGGNMNTATYDPAGLASQLIGEPIEITLAQAATIEAGNDWLDGQFYRITNATGGGVLTGGGGPVLMASKNDSGVVKLQTIGTAFISDNDGGMYVNKVQVGYDWTNDATVLFINDYTNANYFGGIGTSFTSLPWTALSFTGNHFIDLTITTDVAGDCMFSNNTGEFCTVNLVKSNVSGCYIGRNVALTVDGTSTATSYVTDTEIIGGVSCTLTFEDDTVVGSSYFENMTGTFDTGCSLVQCRFECNGENIAMSGLSHSGKTFISGVSSNFEYELDLTDTAIYDATGSGSGSGIITIPSGLEWVGKFIFTGAYAFFDEIKDLTSFVPEVVFVSDATQAGFTTAAAYDMATSTNYQLTAPNWVVALGLFTTIGSTFDHAGAKIPELVIRPMGNFPVISLKTISQN